MTATNLMQNITQIDSGNNAVEYIFAIDVVLNNYFIISILFALLVILIISSYFWSKDLVMSLVGANFTISVSAFITTLIRSEIYLNSSGDPLRLLSFEKFTIFLILLVLSVIYSRVDDG